MIHYIITRFNIRTYTGNENGIQDLDKWIQNRLDLFVPTAWSVLSQRGKFVWLLLIDPLTPEHVRKQLAIDRRIKLVECDNVNDLRFESGWKITTRLDSDDILLEDALKNIQRYAHEGITMVIDFDYRIQDTWKVIDPKRARANSMFASLVNNDPKQSVYCTQHSFLPDKFPSVKINKILAMHIIHGDNLFEKLGNNWQS